MEEIGCISKVIKAEINDAKRTAEVFNLSFYADCMKYGKCPGYNKTEEGIIQTLKRHIVYKVVAEGKIVGAVSIDDGENGCAFPGALCVIPEYAGKGIGQKTMKFVESQFPYVKKWTLEIASDKLENHYFYKKLGFGVTKEYMDGTVKISYFEKQK